MRLLVGFGEVYLGSPLPDRIRGLVASYREKGYASHERGELTSHLGIMVESLPVSVGADLQAGTARNQLRRGSRKVFLQYVCARPALAS